jgi:hypothetical protein
VNVYEKPRLSYDDNVDNDDNDGDYYGGCLGDNKLRRLVFRILYS